MVRDIVINMGECDGFAKLIVMAGGSLWRMIVMARVYCSRFSGLAAGYMHVPLYIYAYAHIQSYTP